MKIKRAFIAALGAFVVASASYAQLAPSPDLARPDVTMWPTLGTTVRVDRANPTIPAQARQVQIEPTAYERLLASGAYPDGAMLAALFHAVELDTAHDPPLYRANEELALALEVIDRSHPDGRRFYLYEPGATTASALPAGNACAVCHAAQGTFDGTFAHLYPGARRFAQPRD
jgi:hypothetical protein